MTIYSYRKYFVLFLCTFLTLFCGAQEDSLLNNFNQAPTPLKKVWRGLNLMWFYRDGGEPRKGIALGHEVIGIAKKNNWDSLMGDGYQRLANLYDDVASFDSALMYAKMSLQINLKYHRQKRSADDYSIMGGIYYNQSMYIKALENFLEARGIREKINDLHGLGQTYNNMANIYKDLDKQSTAYRYHLKAISIYKKENFTRGIAVLLLNSGFDLAAMKDSSLKNIGYSHKQRVDTVFKYYQEALRLFRQIEMPEGIGAVYGNLGLFYNNEKQYDSARIYQERSYAVYKELGSKGDMAASLGDLSIVYHDMKNYAKAIEFGLQAQALAEETGNRYALEEIYRNLYSSYKKLNKTEKALEYHEKWKVTSDSLKGEEENRELTTKSLQYEFGKKAAADSTRNAEEKKVKDAEIRAQQAQLSQEKTQRYFLFVGLGLLLVFGIFMYNRFKVTQRQKNVIAQQKEESDRQKHIIEEKQKEILDSIYYARRIQRSLITQESFIQKTLKRLLKK